MTSALSFNQYQSITGIHAKPPTGGQLMSTNSYDLIEHLRRQSEWSANTFGPGSRTNGLIDHITKELAEIKAKPDDLSEWIDIVILAFDGAWRLGATPEDIVNALIAKQVKNEGRVWPDWRTADPNKAIEHDRSHDVVEAH